MEKINTEVLVSSLLCIGFDKVDSVLFSYVLGQLTIDNQELKLFKFEDSDVHQIFNKYVDFDGIVFKLKDGISLDTMVSYNGKRFYPLRKLLSTSRVLIQYLSQLDFSLIVLKKAKSYGVQELEQIDESRFSHKEIEIFKCLKTAQTNNKAINI